MAPVAAFDVEPGSGPAPGRGGAARAPLKADGRQVSSGALLEPFQTGRRLLETFSPFRIVLLVGLAVFVIVGTRAIGRETFTAWGRALEPDGRPDWGYTLQECEALCAQSPTTVGNCTEHSVEHAKYRLEYQSHKFRYMRQAMDMPELLKDRGYCQLKQNVPRWKSLAAIAVFSFVIALVIQGAKGEVVLIGGCAVLAVCGVVSNDSVYSGLASAGVVGLGLLFPIASAISETGVLERAMGAVLGTPDTLNVALIRLSVSVAIMSAFLSNTATVALMIPVVLSWSRRINIHPGKLMMPLSFVAQLGGSITQVGSSHCVVAADVSKAKYHFGEHAMGIFDMSATAALVAIGTGGAIVLLAGTALLSSSADTGEGADGQASHDVLVAYWLHCRIADGPLVGKSLEATGLERISGVHAAKVLRGSPESLREGDEVHLWCEPSGVIQLRQEAGLSLACDEELWLLGARRRQRLLYEVVVSSDSEFATTDILSHPDRVLREFGAVLVAGPRSAKSASGPSAYDGGCVLLFEAFERWVAVEAVDRWRRACSLITPVPDSSPRRIGGPVDGLRSAAVCAGMLLMILSLALPFKFLAHLELYISASVLVLFYLLIRAISVEKMLSVIKIDILLIIAGAIALGDALTTTGVVSWVASTVLQYAKGKVAVYTMVYSVAVVLGAFVNNSAVVAILAPMLESICEEDASMSFDGLVWLLALASGTCFVTPLGYQTNLMVSPGGRYTFGDFVKFGSVNQIVHMIFSVIFVLVLEPPGRRGAASAGVPVLRSM